MLEVRGNVASLAPPVSAADVAAIGPDVTVLHADGPLDAADLERVDGVLAARPDVALRVHGEGDQLGALAGLPSARRLLLDTVHELRGLDALRHVPRLEDLLVGGTRRPLSLAPLAGLGRLRRLQVAGAHRDMDVLGELGSLEDLTLRSVSLPGLGVLRPLRRLKALDLKLGGIADLSALPELPALEYLEAWRVRGLADLAPVAGIRSLRFLFLQALGKVERLPDLAGCPHVWGVHLESLKAVTDLRPLLAAPALEMLLALDMPQLRWEHVAPLAGHPRLRSVALGTGSARRNAELRERLGLEDARYAKRALRPAV